MINFLIRCSIVFFGIAFITGFSSGIGISTIILAFLFVAIWITIVDLDRILSWIILFAFIFSVIHSDLGLYFVGIVLYAFLFNIIYEYIQKTANARLYIIFFSIFFLSLLFLIMIQFVEYQKILLNFYELFKIVIISIIFFLLARLLILKLERVIGLYTQGHNMRRHI